MRPVVNFLESPLLSRFDLVSFGKHQRKDDVTLQYLQQFTLNLGTGLAQPGEAGARPQDF
jgi:hypothetical protein